MSCELALDDIQANVLPGFGQRHRLLVFCQAPDDDVLRHALQALDEHVTVATRIDDPLALNVALSFDALRRLRGDASAFADEAFRAGLAARSRLLGDDVDESSPGHPCRWVVGGPGKKADILVLLSAKTRRAVDGLGRSLVAGTRLRIVWLQPGATLPGSREHFGFRDEVSQPAVRGLDSTAPSALWPGEFVFGYPTQDPTDPDRPGPDRLRSSAPSWARNGSLLVVRRLRQDVGGFHAFARDVGWQLGVPPEAAAARLIGRKQDGSPLLGDGADMAFSRDDPRGAIVPLAAHVRKMNPRDVAATNGNRFPNPADTLRHRILRRGVPYGLPSASTFERPVHDTVDRGLMFLAYQTSIEDQFEFMQRRWASEPNFPEPCAGFDPLLGRPAHSNSRWFTVGAESQAPAATDASWVLATGGGYFFAPSASALRLLAAA